MLRVSERTDRIRHIPGILYHWRAIPGSIAAGADRRRRRRAAGATPSTPTWPPRDRRPGPARTRDPPPHRVRPDRAPGRRRPGAVVVAWAASEAGALLARCWVGLDRAPARGDRGRAPTAIRPARRGARVEPGPTGRSTVRSSERRGGAGRRRAAALPLRRVEVPEPDWLIGSRCSPAMPGAGAGRAADRAARRARRAAGMVLGLDDPVDAPRWPGVDADGDGYYGALCLRPRGLGAERRVHAGRARGCSRRSAASRRTTTPATRTSTSASALAESGRAPVYAPRPTVDLPRDRRRPARAGSTSSTGRSSSICWYEELRGRRPLLQPELSAARRGQLRAAADRQRR